MAISQQGAIVTYTDTAQNPAAQSITVPSGCKQARLFWCFYGNGANEQITVVLNAAAPTGSYVHPSVAAQGLFAIGVSYWDSPTAGSGTIDWSWPNAPTQGPVLFLQYITADGTLSVIDGDTDGTEGAGTTASATSTSTTGDYVVAIGVSYASEPVEGGSGATSLIASQDNVDANCDLFSIVAGAATTLGDIDGDWPGIAQMVVREAGAPEPPAPQGPPPRGRGHRRSLLGVGFAPRIHAPTMAELRAYGRAA